MYILCIRTYVDRCVLVYLVGQSTAYVLLIHIYIMYSDIHRYIVYVYTLYLLIYANIYTYIYIYIACVYLSNVVTSTYEHIQKAVGHYLSFLVPFKSGDSNTALGKTCM